MTPTRNILPPWAEIDRFTIPGTEAGGEPRGDCFRVAISLAYGIAYEDVPDYDAHGDPTQHARQRAAYEAFAESRGWCWWVDEGRAPITLERWIASVDALTTPGETHAVVMSYDQLVVDHNEWARDPEPGSFYTQVGPRDVRKASALIPADAPGVRGPFWRINRPELRPQGARHVWPSA